MSATLIKQLIDNASRVRNYDFSNLHANANSTRKLTGRLMTIKQKTGSRMVPILFNI